MVKRYARKGFMREPWECKHDWAEDCFVQCGDNGMVFSGGGFEEVMFSEDPLGTLVKEVAKPSTYMTAFFEAFPRNPDTFIRGEGKTIEEAEENAWNKLQKYLACPGHEFVKKGYTNGAGFCKHCNFFKCGAFEPEPPTPEEVARLEKYKKMMAEEKKAFDE